VGVSIDLRLVVVLWNAAVKTIWIVE